MLFKEEHIYMVMLSETQKNQVLSLFTKIKENDEFEIMFNNYKVDNKLSYIKFMNVLKYLKYRSNIDNLNINHEVSLDINLNHEMQTYRVTLHGIKNINEFLNLVHQRKNHVIFSILLTQSEFTQNENFKYIKKSREHKSIIDLDQFDIRIRKSSEEIMTEKEIKNLLNLGLNTNSKITFRYKNRISLELLNTQNEIFSIDLTSIQTDTNINNLMNTVKSYELEMDYFVKKDKKEINNKHFKMILDEMETIKKVLESTDNLITKDELNIVIESYKKLIYFNDYNNATNLYSMQPLSAEVQHIVDKIPNKYSVSDKVDGEKYQLFILQGRVYLISNNLNVLKTSYTSKLNNTIIEGELIYFSEQKKYLFMAFDCLFYNNIDKKNELELEKRIEFVAKVCKEFNEIPENYGDNLNKFYDKLTKLINKTSQNEIIFCPKLFLFPTGASNSEVFKYAYNLWHHCTTQVNCPYKLDGIIFTGLEQKYTMHKKEQKYPIYKYKPPSTNSIDVYITFQRNVETGTYYDMYDNSTGISKDNKIYRVINFFVGDLIGNKEVPIPFLKEENNHEAFFALDRGEIRDIDGNYVQDGTVVEVIYDNNLNIQHQYRWVILRTRWDKTESVLTQQKKYGNFKDVAIKVWKSIKEAVTIEEIKNLSDEDTYNKQQKLLQSRLNASIINMERRQDIYYQKESNLAKKMREFHNWIKSVIIYTYSAPLKEFNSDKERRTSVLDIGCGRGGDIMKWYHARVGEYVGIDVAYNGIYSSTNGAISRYNEFKKKFPDFGKVTWIQADGRGLLNSKDQEKYINNMSEQNKILIDKTFTNKKFDIISFQFSIHYLFDTKQSVDNLIQNIQNHLDIGGFIILTVFDAIQIINKFNNKDSFASYYTDEDGNRQKFFEIIKKFNGNLEDKEGLAVDVFMPWIMEDEKYITEYLITENLLTKTFEKVGCKLIESELFSNLYNLNQSYFMNVIEHEENPKNLKFYRKVAEFYGDLKGIDKESKTWSFLNKYYVYQKLK
jgi:SAM-dependent methyltransferase